MVTPLTRAMDKLLDIFQAFASEYFTLNIVKNTVCMVIPFKGQKWQARRNVYLRKVALKCVENFIKERTTYQTMTTF